MTSKFVSKIAMVVAALFSGGAMAAYQLGFTRGATRLSQEVYDLHIMMMWTITLIFCAVFGVMFYAVYKHRKSAGRKAANFHENTTVEIVWTVVPFFILLAMTVPATKTLLEVREASSADMAVKTSAYQRPSVHATVEGEGEGVALLANSLPAREQTHGSQAMGEFSRNLPDNFRRVK
ncbi:MAG: hypothetical protein EXR28_08890 [Betaproteobacteria bacterium]|nr:hypothetical protein [Betaproteobacteria bacterium]